MSESFEVVGGGTLASAAPAPDDSEAPVEEGGGKTTPENAPQGHEGSTLK